MVSPFMKALPFQVTPFNQELRVASEAVGNGTQATEAVPESSKLACKCEGQEMDGRNLSGDGRP